MADRWAAFADPDPWDDFADDTPTRTKPAPAAKPQYPSLGMDSLTGARDGDTLRLQSGRNLRLFGVDAPELKQQGWDRQGAPVPIGEASKLAIARSILDGAPRIGQPVGNSWGRPVAPVTIGGMDLGQTMARQGQALAAPDYLRDDPARLGSYMDAERLARRNRLGIHDTFHQTPQQHRQNPGYVPSRADVAQFWDTPTPFAGLRPEIESGYLDVTKTGTADQILAYAKANGFTISPDETRKFVANRDGGAKVDWQIGYADKPRPLTDLGDGRAGATVRGVGDGLLAGGLDEAGAVADLLGLTPGRENIWNSDRRLADIWANNQEQNSAILGHDDHAHPYSRLGGQIVGGLALPFGAGARTVPQLFRVGAAYGGAEGFLGTDGNAGQRAIGGAIGVPLGGALGAAGGKLIELGAKYGPGLSRSALARWRGEVPEAAPSALDDIAGAAPRVRDYLDMGEPSGSDPWSRFPDAEPVATVAPQAGARDYLGASAEPISAKDFLFPNAGDDMRSAVIDPQGRIHVLNDPEGHYGFRNAAPDDAGGYVEITNFRDEFALRRPDNPTAAQLRAINELGARARREGVYLTEGGINGGPSPAMSRERDIIDIDEWSDFADADAPGRAQTMGMDTNLDPMPSISQPMRQRDYLDMGPVRAGRMDQPLTDAQRQAIAQGIDPRDVLPIPSNQVADLDEAMGIDAGRIVPATATDEATALGSRGIQSRNGKLLPKLGPVDLVTWLRTQGGVKDQGGELTAMGIGNEGRDLDFARGEQRFGRLVDNDNGMNLDDAAFRAWEAGYLPGNERPDIDAFLDAVGRTHSGSERFYLPDDLPEVERFDGLRADRLALEDMQSRGPVFDDRSVPANEPAPLPPVQAYEEWPAGGPDFAGNINLSKLSSPQDIARALDMTQRRFGFDAATRGRVSQAETERLASELNLTPEKLMSRRQGQAFNAEEALAARQILAKSGNELVNLARRVTRLENPGDEDAAMFQQALLRHAAIQEQVSGMTAEAGRALQQFRMMADSGAVNKEVLASLTTQGGGPRRIVDAAEKILTAVEQSPGKFNTAVRTAANPKLADKQAELFISMILASPRTHIVNMVGNTLTSLAQIPEHAVGGAIGKARQLLPGANPDRITSTEVGQRAFGLIQGTKEGAKMFVTALRTGEASDTFSKVQGHDMRAISGLKGEVIRLPLRFLTAEDELFKGIAHRMEINGLAARQAHLEGLKGEAATARIAELSANPTDEMIEQAVDYSRYLTFQNPLSGTAADISQMVRHNPWLRPVITFVRTPVNLMKFAAERSPAAPLLKGWRADMMAGGARRDAAIAKSMIGTGLATLFYQMAVDGQITGAAPTDLAQRRYWLAQGNQEYSFKIGDKWYSYARLDPFSMNVGVAADLATKADGMSDKQLENYSMLLAGSMIENLSNKVWLSGVTDFIEAVSDTQRYGLAYLRRLAASYTIPNIVNTAAQTNDPVRRERDSMVDEWKSRLPGLSDGLYPMRDIWGRPIANDYAGPDFLSPIRQTTMQNDPVTQEMIDLRARLGPPSKQYSVDGKRQDYTAQQYDQLQALAGQASHEGVAELMSQPGWKAMDGAVRLKAIGKVFKRARDDAKAQVLGMGDGKPSEWDAFPDAGGRSTSPDAWSGFQDAPGQKAAPDEWSGFDDPPQRDIAGELQASIPGVRFTSGYRDQAYQEDMRRRGYNPAYNSSHLDGSAIDMLPPPGRSMNWLKARVAMEYPDARLLIHDGHLHATFPGYYGAPVLGGARSAGLRNPMAGR